MESDLCLRRSTIKPLKTPGKNLGVPFLLNWVENKCRKGPPACWWFQFWRFTSDWEKQHRKDCLCHEPLGPAGSIESAVSFPGFQFQDGGMFTFRNITTDTRSAIASSVKILSAGSKNLKITRSQPVLWRRRCYLLSLLLTVCCSASSSSKRSHKFTSVLYFTLASLIHLRRHSTIAVISACISKVSSGCKQETDAQARQRSRRQLSDCESTMTELDWNH